MNGNVTHAELVDLNGPCRRGMNRASADFGLRGKAVSSIRPTAFHLRARGFRLQVRGGKPAKATEDKSAFSGLGASVYLNHLNQWQNHVAFSLLSSDFS